MNYQKKILYVLLLIAAFVFTPIAAQAVCPVCTIVTCAGIGLARWIGIDDVITGLWIGGFMASLSFSISSFLDKKNIKSKFKDFFAVAAVYSFFLVIMLWANIIGLPENTFCCIDKLLFGIVFGSIILILSNSLYIFLKRKNGGKPHFMYEKIAVPILNLSIASLIFYIILNC